MTWVTTGDPQEFLASAGGFLQERPASNTVPLTVVASLIAGRRTPDDEDAPLFGWWQSATGTEVAGAFIHTPPFPLYLAGPPEHAVAPLADLLASRERRLAGVDGGGNLAALFAACWTARHRVAAVPALHARLYRLQTLRPPPAPPGRATIASARDRDVVVAWLAAFATELRIPAARTLPQLGDRLTAGAYTLWIDDAGEPVALAGISREVGGSRRVGPVFTRADRRNAGYGAAVTAAACRRALDGGTSELLLFADVGNPASNRLYRRLGFEPLEDRRTVRFERAA